MTVTTEEIENYKSILVGENETKEEQLQTQRKRLTDAIYTTLDSNVAPDNDHIAEITAALNKDIQLRDFLLGIPTERKIEDVNSYLVCLMDSIPDEFKAPVASILAANLYSMDDVDSAKELLNTALTNDPRYSLANLLKRVFDSNWPTGAFKTMTDELHPKVKAGMGI